MFILYDFAYCLISIVYLPVLILRGKWHAGFKYRFGIGVNKMLGARENKPCVWFHAVSVGEVMALTQLIERVHSGFPGYTCLCSTVTKTGQAVALKMLGERCRVIYAPLDFSWAVRAYIRLISPVLYVSAETEIWPNLYHFLKQNGIPVLQVNGRISAKSYQGYRRFRFLFAPALRCVDRYLMQSRDDAQRIEQLGVAKENIRVTGNLKFDICPPAASLTKASLGYDEEDDLMIAGSTHPGEEEILIECFIQWRTEFPRLRLLLAPRHTERTEEIFSLIRKNGAEGMRFSEIKLGKRNAQAVMVVDTMGDLRALYHLATVVFIGKTLKVGGGQNMIEPAALGKTTIIGPKAENFNDTVKMLLENKGLIQVRDAGELLLKVPSLLRNRAALAAIGEAARAAVKVHQGATDKTCETIARYLNPQ